MADWAVECPPSSGQLDSTTQDSASPLDPRDLEALASIGELDGGKSLLSPYKSAERATCVRYKFGPWQFNVLTSLQGYLARLPLQQQQLMVLQHFSRSTREMQDNSDEMHGVLLETTTLQREALETLQKTTDHIVALIDDHMIPFIDNLPDVSGLDDFVAQLQEYADNTESAVAFAKKAFAMTLPATALLLIFVNWMSGIPALYTMLPSLAICITHRLGLLPFQYAFFGLWLLFLVLRMLRSAVVEQMPEEELMYQNIARLLEANRHRHGKL